MTTRKTTRRQPRGVATPCLSNRYPASYRVRESPTGSRSAAHPTVAKYHSAPGDAKSHAWRPAVAINGRIASVLINRPKAVKAAVSFDGLLGNLLSGTPRLSRAFRMAVATEGNPAEVASPVIFTHVAISFFSDPPQAPQISRLAGLSERHVEHRLIRRAGIDPAQQSSKVVSSNRPCYTAASRPKGQGCGAAQGFGVKSWMAPHLLQPIVRLRAEPPRNGLT